MSTKYAKNYQLHNYYKTDNKYYNYVKELTDGENIIFVSGKWDDELGECDLVVSEPCKIGNAP